MLIAAQTKQLVNPIKAPALSDLLLRSQGQIRMKINVNTLHQSFLTLFSLIYFSIILTRYYF